MLSTLPPSRVEKVTELLAAGDRVPLARDALLSPLPGSLGLRALGIHLLLDDPGTLLLGLGLVDLQERQRPGVVAVE